MPLKLNTLYLSDFISSHELDYMAPALASAHKLLEDKTGPGNDFLGWLSLGNSNPPDELARMKESTRWIQDNCDILVVIGIGGSYLGAKAALDFLRSPNYNALPKSTPDIIFVGNTLSPDALNESLALCKGKRVCLNVISKSGTTTEAALAFRVFRALMVEQYGKEGAKDRIFCTTDAARGSLKSLADTKGYPTFVIPDDVGGRFSLFTPVGLLPIAVAGCDIDAILSACTAAQKTFASLDLEQNPAYKYAAIRNLLHRKGRMIEVLVSYEPALTMLGEWYKQLYGESEGKDGKGLYPSSMCFSTDLHSLGQFVQEGSNILFETVLQIAKPQADFFLAPDSENFDGLNFLADQNLSAVNQKAFLGTLLAHLEGGVPNMVIEIDDRSEKSFGELIFFFEKACAVSGYLLGVNPFDQPGVEAYKKNMFALLGKPGFESAKKELEDKLLKLSSAQ
ncbi:MAG: glucose-6-phosphate isomerase [Oscillospiraceae bacterium]|nr:glucose-6-phosphate isomerase [Oscillospiraceae bacterium]